MKFLWRRQTRQRLAQLILFPKVQTRNQVKGGETGFGSSDAYWLTNHSNHSSLGLYMGKVFLVFWISVQIFLLWLPVNGQDPEQSSNELYWRDGEGHERTCWLYIVPQLSVNLWGWDIMTWIGVYLYPPPQLLLLRCSSKGCYPIKTWTRRMREELIPSYLA